VPIFLCVPRVIAQDMCGGIVGTLNYSFQSQEQTIESADAPSAKDVGCGCGCDRGSMVWNSTTQRKSGANRESPVANPHVEPLRPWPQCCLIETVAGRSLVVNQGQHAKLSQVCFEMLPLPKQLKSFQLTRAQLRKLALVIGTCSTSVTKQRGLRMFSRA